MCDLRKIGIGMKVMNSKPHLLDKCELLAFGLIDSTATGTEYREKKVVMEGWRDVVRRAEKLVQESMKGNDASHDAAHVYRVRDLALAIAAEEGLSSSPDSMLIVIIFPFFQFIVFHFIKQFDFILYAQISNFCP